MRQLLATQALHLLLNVLCNEQDFFFPSSHKTDYDEVAEKSLVVFF